MRAYAIDSCFSVFCLARQIQPNRDVCLGQAPWHGIDPDAVLIAKRGHSVWDEDQPLSEWQAAWEAVVLAFEVGSLNSRAESVPGPKRDGLPAQDALWVSASLRR